MGLGFNRGFGRRRPFDDGGIPDQSGTGDLPIATKAAAMMRALLFPFLLTLAACAANRPAPPNPNSVPNVLQDITAQRSTEGAIFVTGGLYSGAAAGQTTRFVALPDDRVICTFQTEPVLPIDGPDIVVTAHRLQIPGVHAALLNALLPNVLPENSTVTSNFQVDIRTANVLTSSQTGFGDPRLEALTSVFSAFPAPCWAFG